MGVNEGEKNGTNFRSPDPYQQIDKTTAFSSKPATSSNHWKTCFSIPTNQHHTNPQTRRIPFSPLHPPPLFLSHPSPTSARPLGGRGGRRPYTHWTCRPKGPEPAKNARHGASREPLEYAAGCRSRSSFRNRAGGRDEGESTRVAAGSNKVMLETGAGCLATGSRWMWMRT